MSGRDGPETPILPGEMTREELKAVVGELLERVEDLEARVEDVEHGDDGDDGDDEIRVPIEVNARTPEDARMLTENRNRAVEVWKDLPRWSHYSMDGKSFVLDAGELKQAVADVEDRPVRDVHNTTVKRVRRAISELTGGVASIEETSTETVQGTHERVLVVKRVAWAKWRTREACDQYLPEEMVEELHGESGGGD